MMRPTRKQSICLGLAAVLVVVALLGASQLDLKYSRQGSSFVCTQVQAEALYPVSLSLDGINDYAIPFDNQTDFLRILLPTDRQNASRIEPRTFLMMRATVNETVSYGGVKVYDSQHKLIGMFMLFMNYGLYKYMMAHNQTPTDNFGEGKLTTYDNPVWVILDRPLAYDETITVVLYNGNDPIGVWSGVVH